MKAALLIVLSLSAMAFAGPAFNKNNQINQQQQQQTYMTATAGSDAKSPAIDILKQWCFSSQMSQQELTASFKKLVSVVKSTPVDQTTESAVLSERICQGALVQKSQQTGQTVGQTGADAKAHELIKDVYMDALISCKSRDCTQQLLKIISSQQVDAIRASYYMTRIAVSDKQSLKDEAEVKQFAESFIEHAARGQSEAVERQKLFATTSLIGKWIQTKPQVDEQFKQVAGQVAKTIVERYVKPVSEAEIEQYKQSEQPAAELAKKVAKRSAALKALANIPGHVLKQIASAQEIEQALIAIVQNKRELSTARQSAIECFEQNDKQMQLLKQLTFDQEEPIEVRIAAYRALMTVAYAADDKTADESAKEQMAAEIVDQIVKHCEDERNQQQDDQFVLYAISHLDNVRTSQQPEHRAIKETIAKNKQHYMQVQVLCKKFKAQLNDVRRSSRNYKLEQEFNQLESGLVLEGDLIYESQHYKSSQQPQQQQQHILPKLVRVNMSMPIMGETVNVIELTVRQNQMDEEILSALKLVQNTKFNSQSVSKVVDSFKSSVEKQQQQQQQQKYATGNTNTINQVEADLTIKVDGCTIVYLCVDDIKSVSGSYNSYAFNTNQQHQRNTRSIYASGNSIVEDIVEFLKRQPVNFNRGFNVNFNERLAKVLDVDANILAGLRFESRAQGSAKAGDFEIVAQMEPRFSFEAVVGPAKVSSKKLLQRLSTKTALGLRLRFKRDELVDVSVELPMNNMELFTVETQLVEKTTRSTPYSYNYLPESIYGDEDIYASYPIYSAADYTSKLAKRSIVSKKSSFGGFGKGSYKGEFSHSYESSEKMARATGLRGKLRVAASPRDMSLLVSAIVQKYEPQMQGYRVKIEKTQRGSSAELKQYLVSVSTPGSRYERTMQLRVAKQSSAVRTIVKCDVSAPQMSFGFSTELVHDGRQYAVKSELASHDSRSQWRHALEAGLASGAQSPAGRIAHFSYKPYLQLESTSLKRPIALAGLVAFQQSPKSVISYELKCSTTGDFVQGKLIVEARNKRAGYAPMQRARRSMQSPIDLILSTDFTFTNELVAQVQQHALKVHSMADWECQQYALKADSAVVYKNQRKAAGESRMAVSMKLDQEQQYFTIEAKCASSPRKDFVYRIVSQVRPSGHQMDVECRYAGNQMQSYKHKIELVKSSPKKYEASVQIELADSERQISEKFAGRARIQNERALKTIEAELSSRTKLAKLSFDFASLAKHQLVFVFQGARFQHKCELRNNERQFYVQSRTDDKQTGQMVAKLMMELVKEQLECKLACEWPAKRVALAAELALVSGKRSSFALTTGRFASQAEFSFETFAANTKAYFKQPRVMGYLSPFGQKPVNMRFRSSLKDLVGKQAYWMDSALNGADESAESYLRFDSPYYRTDVEFSPRELQAKLGAFARSKRSIADNYEAPLYSAKDSALTGLGSAALLSSVSEKLNLGNNKMWMLRSIIASPYARDALKQKARDAFFEYADKRQAHQHSMKWAPEGQRFSMELSRAPNTDFVSASTFEPMRAKADLSTSWSRPSSFSLNSELMDADLELKPYDGEEAYAKLSALSRSRRSAFKKHESEFRYNKHDGYKAHMKHQDKREQRHALRMEADAEPHKWAKMSYDGDKHGKASWEHSWRKQQVKRAHDQEKVYANKIAFSREGPVAGKYQHETRFDWQEPTSMSVFGKQQHYRQRRSYPDNYNNYNNYNAIYNSLYNLAKYSPAEYLKHTNARLVSSTSYPSANYKLDFDYQPQLNLARLSVDMPEDMQHATEINYKPSEGIYKLSSKYLNRVSSEPHYAFVAASKPFGLATGEQEPVFVASEHEMFERPISKSSMAYQLFKQPMKLDYSDKYGRVASIDYDASPIAGPYSAGLRQKRAAVYYKDSAADFEHSTSYDFYPESYMAKMKPSYYAAKKQQQQQQQQQPGDVAFKTQTKYGPIVVRADSSDETVAFELSSPLMNAKLMGETGANMRQLFKMQLDNKSQRVQLAKLLRDAPASIRELKLAKKFARKFDSGRFEHQSELLVGIVDQIFKLKSVNKFNERPVVVIEGEWSAQAEKAFVKINGERVAGQAVVDLARKSADLIVDIDDKHTLHHVTRLVRTSDTFYALDSVATYKSRPIYKLTGKVSAMIFDPAHLFARRQYLEQQAQPAHVSTFEAVVYEPKEYHVSGQFDCDKKEARVMFKGVEEQRVSETYVRFDDIAETVHFESRLSSPIEGQIYACKAQLSLPGLYQADECRATYAGKYAHAGVSQGAYYGGMGPQSCQSDVIYADKSGNWSAKYVPGEYVTVSSPRGKQTINLAAGYYY